MTRRTAGKRRWRAAFNRGFEIGQHDMQRRAGAFHIPIVYLNKENVMANWYEDIAIPLHAALDDATALKDATDEQRWAHVMKACPWFAERAQDSGFSMMVVWSYCKENVMANWYEDIAIPLHAALDDATALKDATDEQRWAHVMKACPWLAERADETPAIEHIETAPASQWIPLESSNLDAYRRVKIARAEPVDSGPLDEANMDSKATTRPALDIRFKSGATYRYFDVPEDIIKGLIESASPGRYFGSEIRGKFEHQMIEGKS